MHQENEPKPKIRIEVVGSVIGAIFGVGSFAVALLSYVRPTDAAHPIHFDFLYKTISFPLWAAGTIMAAVIAITAGIVRWTIKRPQTPPIARHVKPAVLPIESEFTRLAPKLVENKPAITSTHPTHSEDALAIPSPEDLLIRLRVEEFQGTKSCVLLVDNNRLDAIGGASVTIYGAYSFDSNHQAFRQLPAVSGIRMDQMDVINPSFSGKPFLIVRKEPDKEHLFAGNNTANLMIWPENDKSEIQKWKMSLSVFPQTWPRNPTSMPKPLTLVKIEIIVTWNKATNELFVEGP